jgi:hypothetical protein
MSIAGSYLLTFIILLTPTLRNIFTIRLLSPNHLLLAFVFSLIPLGFGEISKLIKIKID